MKHIGVMFLCTVNKVSVQRKPRVLLARGMDVVHASSNVLVFMSANLEGCENVCVSGEMVGVYPFGQALGMFNAV